MFLEFPGCPVGWLRRSSSSVSQGLRASDGPTLHFLMDQLGGATAPSFCGLMWARFLRSSVWTRLEAEVVCEEPSPQQVAYRFFLNPPHGGEEIKLALLVASCGWRDSVQAVAVQSQGACLSCMCPGVCLCFSHSHVDEELHCGASAAKPMTIGGSSSGPQKTVRNPPCIS